VGGEYSRKELFEQFNDSLSKHQHMTLCFRTCHPFEVPVGFTLLFKIKTIEKREKRNAKHLP
jgi:hypothetical protein